VPANETGLPGISLPAGLGRDGLPIGVQFSGNFCRDDLLLQVAAQLDRTCPEWFAVALRYTSEWAIHIAMPN